MIVMLKITAVVWLLFIVTFAYYYCKYKKIMKEYEDGLYVELKFAKDEMIGEMKE